MKQSNEHTKSVQATRIIKILAKVMSKAERI